MAAARHDRPHQILRHLTTQPPIPLYQHTALSPMPWIWRRPARGCCIRCWRTARACAPPRRRARMGSIARVRAFQLADYGVYVMCRLHCGQWVVCTDRVSGSPASKRRSCRVVIVDKPKNINYNKQNNNDTGDTYFLRADEAPTTRLEGVARSIFDFHTVRVWRFLDKSQRWFYNDTNTHTYDLTSLVDDSIQFKHKSVLLQQHAAYDPARSGAEWWVQVLDEDDDIGERKMICVYVDMYARATDDRTLGRGHVCVCLYRHVKPIKSIEQLTRSHPPSHIPPHFFLALR